MTFELNIDGMGPMKEGETERETQNNAQRPTMRTYIDGMIVLLRCRILPLRIGGSGGGGGGGGGGGLSPNSV